jgi:hypothetical protein
MAGAAQHGTTGWHSHMDAALVPVPMSAQLASVPTGDRYHLADPHDGQRRSNGACVCAKATKQPGQ